MKWYTVTGVYRSEGVGFAYHTRADDPYSACENIRRRIEQEYQGYEPEVEFDFAAVFHGRLREYTAVFN